MNENLKKVQKEILKKIVDFNSEEDRLRMEEAGGFSAALKDVDCGESATSVKIRMQEIMEKTFYKFKKELDKSLREAASIGKSTIEIRIMDGKTKIKRIKPEI